MPKNGEVAQGLFAAPVRGLKARSRADYACFLTTASPVLSGFLQHPRKYEVDCDAREGD